MLRYGNSIIIIIITVAVVFLRCLADILLHMDMELSSNVLVEFNQEYSSIKQVLIATDFEAMANLLSISGNCIFSAKCLCTAQVAEMNIAVFCMSVLVNFMGIY
jgi:virulence-associated protein VapD